MRGINPIYRYLSGSNAQIERLIAQVNHRIKLDHTLKQVLDTEFAPHCRLGSIQGDEISILVDSPVWATRLQYKKSEILLKFNQLEKFRHISKVNIKVAPCPDKSEQTSSGKQNARQSDVGSQCLENLASTTPDTPLSEALRRLSHRLKKKS